MSRALDHRRDTAGRRSIVCRLTILAGLVALHGAATLAAAGSDTDRHVIVRETRGVYSVEAMFHVPQPAAIAFEVLTDYAAIPRFMPAVRTSVVRERIDRHVIVEQESLARFMLFTKRVHLVLDVEEHPSIISFRDRSGRSFHHYEGAWQIEEMPRQTRIRYELTAKPSFAVPDFLLQRLLKRDAAQMVEALQIEMARRSPSASD